MSDNVTNRDRLLAALRRELVGPDPVVGAKPLSVEAPPIFDSFADRKGPWVDAVTGAEVLSQDAPTKRYGVGVLHPVPNNDEGSMEGHAADQLVEDAIAKEDFAPEDPEEVVGASAADLIDGKQAERLEKTKERIEKAISKSAYDLDPDDAFDVSGANGFRPSSMAVSFLAEVAEDLVMRVSVPALLPAEHAFGEMPVNGCYRKFKVKRKRKSKGQEGAADGAAQADASSGTPGQVAVSADAKASATPAEASTAAGGAEELVEDVLWRREQMELEYVVSGKDLLQATGKFLKLRPNQAQKPSDLRLSLEVLARPFADQEGRPMRLITANLVNRSPDVGGDEQCLFQAYFDVRFERGGELVDAIHPYPAPPRDDLEEQSNLLLYRNTPTFATGHGCAADWLQVSTSSASVVRAECLPVHELPSITPDITKTVMEDGRPKSVPINVSMRGLAGLEEGFDILGNLKEICDGYAAWIAARREELPALPTPGMQATGEVHLAACERALERMRAGLDYLRGDELALKAFKWANHAILLQQIRSGLKLRTADFDAKEYRLNLRDPYPEVTETPKGDRGSWRAFQIAFLLLSVESAVKGEHPDREIVDLIWFPTGGGKTEAYLGLTAFSLFIRRLIDQTDDGVHILMRYTLRLLTAQQFQRATTLICAMEYLRRSHADELGEAPFSAGIWVGGSTTPNRREHAVKALNDLTAGRSEKNPFLITKCPWCGAEMGPVEVDVPLPSEEEGPKPVQRGRASGGKAKRARRPQGGKHILTPGYRQSAGTVMLHCSDPHCDFSKALPIFTIDQDVYEQRPALIIGTVDKFAMLAWRPEARQLFGWGTDGKRMASPPGLIIQDELHLISGPLGSMAGLFEAVIEELCTDRRDGREIRPKIVCSTATIRAYREQVKALYARDSTELFPPPGLDVSDSFFAQYALEEDKSPKPGRMYVGVNGPGHGSMQTTQVRTFSALLQYPVALTARERDPWWTLLAFFNSLRELGTTVTLFQSDIPDYLKIMQERYGLSRENVRQPWRVEELTGRLDSEDVPLAIKKLEVTTDDPGEHAAVDVCLASNIIEVGVDIGRLSVMAIVGQPKTTSQYIQVSGRVGRRWWERPGVVVTLYNASKPRDRSHFEKFRTYHEQLYAQVEPTSVTPFSPPALDRGLHAALVAFIRQQAELTHDGPAVTPKVFPEDLGQEFRELMLERVALIDPEEKGNVERVLDNAVAAWKALRKDRYHVTGGLASTDPGLLTPAGQHVNPEVRELTWMTPQSMRNVDATCEAKISSLPELDALRRSQKEKEND